MEAAAAARLQPPPFTGDSFVCASGPGDNGGESASPGSFAAVLANAAAVPALYEPPAAEGTVGPQGADRGAAGEQPQLQQAEQPQLRAKAQGTKQLQQGDAGDG